MVQANERETERLGERECVSDAVLLCLFLSETIFRLDSKDWSNARFFELYQMKSLKLID